MRFDNVYDERKRFRELKVSPNQTSYQGNTDMQSYLFTRLCFEILDGKEMGLGPSPSEAPFQLFDQLLKAFMEGKYLPAGVRVVSPDLKVSDYKCIDGKCGIVLAEPCLPGDAISTEKRVKHLLETHLDGIEGFAKDFSPKVELDLKRFKQELSRHSRL